MFERRSQSKMPRAEFAAKRRLGVAVAFFLLLGLAVLSVFTVGSTEHALVLEFGKPVRVVASPGLHFKLPYQSVQSLDNRIFVYSPASSEFLTLEKTPVVAASTILWRIQDPKRFYETVLDRTGAESRLGDIVFAEIGNAIGRNALAAFYSTEPNAYLAESIISEVTTKCRAVAEREYGIQIVDLLLRNFSFPAQNRPRLYARMASERGQISMKYRSEGEEEGLKVRATGDQEKTKILTEALKLSQQSRAEGEGQAAHIYSEALGKDPKFYDFLRTLDASRNLVPKGTMLVLPADSELFGLLYDKNYYERGYQRKGSGKVSKKPNRKEGTMQ